MSYLVEVLPSLLRGALVSLQVFALCLILSLPLGAIILLASIAGCSLALAVKYLCSHHAGNAFTLAADFYLLYFA